MRFFSRPVASKLFVLIPLGWSTFGRAANPAMELMALRTEVETVQGEIDSRKASARARLEALTAQKTDLEMELKRERQKISTLETELRKRSENQQQVEKKALVLQPLLLDTASALRASIDRSLPFKSKERKAEIDSLSLAIQQASMKPTRALARLWSFLEDELRLAHENGLFRQVVQVNGEEKLADVARVGMAMLFFRTNDGQVGMAQNSQNGWSFLVTQEPKQQKAINTLFDSFRKGIKVGHFLLPSSALVLNPQQRL